jgi:propanediol dehydratase small subunit
VTGEAREAETEAERVEARAAVAKVVGRVEAAREVERVAEWVVAR